MKTINVKSIITIITLLLSVYAFSQGPGGRGGRGGRDGGGLPRGGKPDASEILKMLDANDDKKIDKEAAAQDRRGKISENFGEIDANADGFIDLEELKEALNHRGPRRVSAEKVMKEVDQNEDGFLNELEIAAKDKRELIDNFNTIDSNEDGQLDIDELKVFYKNNKDKKRKRKNREKNKRDRN